jgi:AcrR family transcriptional regulator
VSTHRRRKYQLRARADRQRQTRERIVAATAALHATRGPARTTIADIARLAGVQRLTVYNAFPNPQALLRACQARFLADHPLPALDPARGRDPFREFEHALRRLYRWYRATEAMERNVHRDRHLVPELDELMAKTGDQRFRTIADAHAAAVGGRASRPLRAMIRLALNFPTWELLSREELTDNRIAAIMARAVRATASSAQRRRR